MSITIYYILFGVGAGLAMIFFLRYLHLALRLTWAFGKLALMVLLILLAGWAMGFWNLPAPMVRFLYGLDRLWEPSQIVILRWIRGLFR